MNKRSVCKINDMKYPAADKISSRTSTICRSMACTLLKREPCSPEVEAEWMNFFKNKTCAYCGRPATHLDHLYPLIDNRKPTGYGTEPGNLVPCCSSCNQPKGNDYWEDFMRSSKCKHVGSQQNPDPQKAMQERIDIINGFQKAIPAQKIDIDPNTLKKWTDILTELDKALVEAEDILMNIKAQIYSGTSYGNNQLSTTVKKSKSAVTSANNDDSPVILLTPSDPIKFKADILQTKQAEITWKYSDGTQIVNQWKATNFSESSDVMNNIRSKKKWRSRVNDGLVEVNVKVI